MKKAKEKKEKRDISEALRIILVRSFTYLSLLVIIIFILSSLKRANQPNDPQKSPSQAGQVIAIINGHGEHKQHLKGLRDGLLYSGINIPCLEYSSLAEINEQDILYLIGTDKVNEALKRFPHREIIGCAVFQEKPSEHYTGIFCGKDWVEVLKIYREVLPQFTTIGLLYAEDSPESLRQYEALQKIVKNEANLQIKTLPFSLKEKNLTLKLNAFLDTIDVFWGLPDDKNTEKLWATIAEICLSRKIPFIGGGKKAAQMGSLIALEYNQELLGRKAAEILVEVIKKNTPCVQIPILIPHPEIFVNLSTAYKLNIVFPQHILQQAKEKYH